MIRRPPRSTLDRSSAASDVYKRQSKSHALVADETGRVLGFGSAGAGNHEVVGYEGLTLSLIHISEPTRPY